ncbi:MAG: bifunctional riboflavin kinase/FAD synthetase [Pseudomonadota bacterium]|jgi:riboflavin kinase / FMN adenylyltransferase
MLLVRDIQELPSHCRGAVVAIGNFDGVHLGHRAVLAQAGALARGKGCPVGALVFEPHPREFLNPGLPRFRLTPLRDKARLLQSLGLDLLYVQRFDAFFASRPAEDFVTRILVEGLGVTHIVVGYDFHFGKGRTGDAALLQRMGKEAGFDVTVIAAVKTTPSGEPYSSSLIREHLIEGRPRRAAELLGHWWSIEGHVVKGDQRGRTIGFPTANLALDECLEPKHGVYAVRAMLANESGTEIYDGVANIGMRPTFNKQEPILEVNLFDYSGDLYGRLLRVMFIEFLRPERKFNGLESLQTQITADCEQARAVLLRTPVDHV